MLSRLDVRELYERSKDGKSNRCDKIGEIVKIYPPVQARTTEAHDTSRDRVFKCEIWNPSAAGTHPLVVYSHFQWRESPCCELPV